MRTFTLLTAIVLVALQTKAEPVPRTDDAVPDQEQTDAEDKIMAISCAEDETSALRDQDLHFIRLCDPCEEVCGICHEFPTLIYFCCRRRHRDEE
uniref:Alpha-defensin N-terminal domain-containing protein n=1 Tax=Oryctolagus cuniculus TaxID=9986 RepID=A0A5F9D444_RABIT